MPLTHDPDRPSGGPGSAFASTTLQSKVRRRRRKKTPVNNAAPSSQQKQGLIGEDLLDWQDENVTNEAHPTESSASRTVKVVSNKKAKRSDKTGSSKTERSMSPSPENETARQTSTEAAKMNAASSHVTPSSSATKGPSSLIPMTDRSYVCPPRARHALAVDTRALETDEGMAAFHSVRQQALCFMSTLARRGAAPCVLGSSHAVQQQSLRKAKSPRAGSNTRGAMEAKAKRLTKEELTALERFTATGLEDMIQPVLIHPPLNAGNVQNRKAVHVPKRLLAHDSWKLFGDLGT